MPRKERTWLFSEEEHVSAGQFAAGACFVVRNDIIKCVTDVEPVNDRTSVITLNHARPIPLLALCAPHAFRPEEEK
eukprot:9059329-Pyramimonas_sp.AAC.1